MAMFGGVRILQMELRGGASRKFGRFKAYSSKFGERAET